jgi:hypothetical protein
MLGLDKPVKVAETDPDGKELPTLADRARALAALLAEIEFAAADSATAISENIEETPPAVNQHVELEGGR